MTVGGISKRRSEMHTMCHSYSDFKTFIINNLGCGNTLLVCYNQDIEVQQMRHYLWHHQLPSSSSPPINNLLHHISERQHAVDIKRRYGLTKAQYAERLLQQHNGCAICGRGPQRYRLQVDHNHKTKRTRGLLCGRCNRYLVPLETTIWRTAAEAYLARWT